MKKGGKVTGKNLDPWFSSARGRISSKNSPWRKGPAINTNRAKEEFAKRRPPPKG